MEDKKAAEILIKLLEKDSLSGEEKEAIVSAVGILGWTSLAKSRIDNITKARKNKRDRDGKWKEDKEWLKR